ncbi:MAG: alginate export family protein [Tannerellaceae bacterium]|nr:alginate export family protein [Tannerellaceae bacterium]
MFSASNWSNTGNAHDALLLKYTPEDFTIHLGGAWNNGSDVNFETAYDQTYKSLIYTWLSRRFGAVDISAIFVNEGFQKGNTPEEVKHRHHRNTIGGNIALDDKNIPLYLYATLYHQFGHDRVGKDLSANLFAFRAEYTFQPTILALAGVDYLSGIAYDETDGKNHTFNKLYGTNHAFNGSMEYWGTPPTQGLVDIYAGITVKPFKKFQVNGTYHQFSTVKKLAETGKKGLGSEVDITLDYNLSPHLAFQGGWSGYFTTDGTKEVDGLTGIDTHFPQWAYLMITFKF